MQISRLDPMQCGLDTADEMAAVHAASLAADGWRCPAAVAAGWCRLVLP